MRELNKEDALKHLYDTIDNEWAKRNKNKWVEYINGRSLIGRNL